MRMVEIRYKAPENATQLAAMESLGVLGAPLTYDALATSGPSQIPIGPSGGEAAHQQYQEETKSTWAKIGDGLNNVLQSQELQSLIDAGLTYYSSREDRQYAEEQAALARQRAALQEKMAQAQIEDAKREQRRLREMAQAEQRQATTSPTPQPSGGGIPGWVIPAVGAGSLILVIAMTMTKRKKK